MTRAGVLILLGSARLLHLAGALRAKDQGLSHLALATNTTDGAEEAVADVTPSENTPDLAKIMEQVLKPKAAAGGAAPQKSFDFGNVMGNIIQQAMKPKAPADGAASKNSFDFGKAVGNMVQQVMKPKATVVTPSPAPNKGSGNFIDWIRDQLKKAVNSSTTSANQAAKETAESSLKDLVQMAWTRAGKAAKQAQGTQKEQAKPAATKHVDAGMNEAKQKLADAWRSLMDKAKDSAKQAAEANAHNVLEKSAHAQETAKIVSKAAVDSSIAAAIHHMNAVEKADAAVKSTAQKAAQQASEKALHDLLEWSQADENAIAEVTEGKDKASEKALKELMEWSQADEASMMEAAEIKDEANGDHPVRDAWADAIAAVKKARAADWVAKSVEAMTAKADKIYMQGHNVSKALSKTGQPGATGVAMAVAKEIMHRANLTARRSGYVSKIAKYIRILLVKAIKAALKTTSMEDFKKAWKAVLRIYGASGRAEEDARRALVSSRDAVQSVAVALAEVGARAVGEVLRAELILLSQVVSKAIQTDSWHMLGAWLQGLGSVQSVAQKAWLKGFSQGIQTVAKKDGRHVMGKVADASKSTAAAGAAWIRTLSEVLNSKEARQAIGKAATSATKAASAAAAATASHTADSLGKTAAEMAKKGQLPFLPKGSEYTASGSWNLKDGYKGELFGNYMGSDFRGGINVKPNRTHGRSLVAGHINSPNGRKLEVTSVSIKGNSVKQSSESKWAVRQTGAKQPAAGTAGTLRTDPLLGQNTHVQSSGIAWRGAEYGAGAIDAVAAPDGRSAGKFAGKFKTSAMKQPLEVKKDFVQSVPNTR